MSAIEALKALADAERAHQMRAYHKTDREVLGVSNPQIDIFIKSIRSTPEADLITADELWQTGIFDARIAAGKMLTRKKLAPELDQAFWQAIQDYASEFDGWAIADTMATAAHQRILSPSLSPKARYRDLQPWTKSDHLWTKRAALVYTLPFTRLKSPNNDQIEAIEAILQWASEYTHDPEWFIQKSVAWWLRELSKRNPICVQNFLEQYGQNMKAFAKREAGKYL